MQDSRTMGVLDWGLLFVLSMLWGGSFFFSKIALKEVGPLTIVLARGVIATLALYVYLRAARQAIPTATDQWTAFFGMGLLNNLIPFSLIVWGQTQITSGLASILTATTPIFSIVVAHFFTEDEPITPNKIAGIVLGLLGVGVLMAGVTDTSRSQPILALIACLAGALSYGAAGVFGRRFSRMRIAPAVGAFGQIAATTIMVVPTMLVLGEFPRTLVPSGPTIMSLLSLGVFSTALAYIMFFRILAVSGAVNSSLVTLLIPVSAIVLGSLFLGERLTYNQFAGMALISLGLLLIDGRLVDALSSLKLSARRR